MNGDDIARIAYLALLLVAVAGWAIAANRRQLGKMAQQAAIWGFIFIGVIAAAGLWQDIRNDIAPRAAVVGDAIEIPRGIDGHYHVQLMLNKVPVDFIVDTGATDLVLSKEDASRIGLDPNSLAFIGEAVTANGTVRTARVVIPEVEIGGLTERNVRASVTDGDMQGSLLGMSYLQRFARIEISGGKMVLQR